MGLFGDVLVVCMGRRAPTIMRKARSTSMILEKRVKASSRNLAPNGNCFLFPCFGSGGKGHPNALGNMWVPQKHGGLPFCFPSKQGEQDAGLHFRNSVKQLKSRVQECSHFFLIFFLFINIKLVTVTVSRATCLDKQTAIKVVG